MTDPLASFRSGKGNSENETSNSNPLSSFSNDQIKKAKDYARDKGMNYRDAFFQLCKEQGKDPMPFLKKLGIM